ncbi:SUKH-3 domain-containing protein [Plantactinospora sp. KBS50]|uniref:SUKH-3 domain-containing protein n=1 Tax=Plantactinospora sp. KBS50 TaxID=2024580 RepID=UPI000BAAB0DD|nr:SUKH-3 domain-containing protein [Plantactinospora sp. KBS50]ASW57126.1 hypothetical protein CIK06_27745 [Plantactinospora sp. KBS50]
MTDERFPAAVAEALGAAGWRPGRRDETLARDLGLAVAGYATPDGRQHVVVPAAIEAYAEFGGLRVTPVGDGERVAPSAVDLDPRRALPAVRTLAGLAEVLGGPLSPLGVEGDNVGILAVGGSGRVFLLDHTAEWFAGESVAAALTALLSGHELARIAEDGTW